MHPLNRTPTCRVIASLSAGLFAASIAQAATPKDYAMPYSTNTETSQNQGLTLVSSTDFALSASLVPVETRVIDPRVHSAGTFATGNLTDFRPHTLIYGQGDRWMKAPLRGGLNPTPVQVSSESAASTRCGVSRLVTLDFKDASAALLAYRVPGTDTKCGTKDDIFRTVSIADGAGIAPKVAKATTLDLDAVYSTNGVLLAHYALEARKINRYKPDLSAATLVKDQVTKFLPVGQTQDGSLIAIIDGKLRRIDANGALVAAILKTPDAGFTIEERVAIADGQIYFVESTIADPNDPSASLPSRIYRVAIAGGAAVRMLNLTARSALQGLTTNKLLFTVGGGGVPRVPVELKAFPRTGTTTAGAQSSLRKVPVGFVSVFATFNDRVFYNVIGDKGVQTAYSCKDDGTGQANSGSGSAWVGRQAPATIPVSDLSTTKVARLMIARLGKNGSTRSATLFSVDPANVQPLKQKKLVDLPDTAVATFSFASGPGALGGLIAGSGQTANTDVFAFDLLGARFRRLNDNTPADESPLF
ncbi:MAG: hypothetical protein ACT4PZ_11520 [Panacagrimonas sp.]